MARAGLIACIILLIFGRWEMPGQRSQQEKEWPTLVKVAREKGLTQEDTLLLLAIRGAEQGPAGFEFGVKAAKGTDLAEQARWSANTIKNNRLRFNQLQTEFIYPGSRRQVTREMFWDSPNPDFIEFMGYYGGPTGYGWAPIHYQAMPEKERRSNQNWSKNVRSLMEKYRKQFKEKGIE